MNSIYSENELGVSRSEMTFNLNKTNETFDLYHEIGSGECLKTKTMSLKYPSSFTNEAKLCVLQNVQHT